MSDPFALAFDALVEKLTAARRGDERFTLALAAEVSDFVRMNEGRVRQAGQVTQGELTLTLAEGQRAVSVSFPLSLTRDDDERALAAALARARDALAVTPDDPHLVVCDEAGEIHVVDEREVTPAEDITRALLLGARGLDLVGILARGPIVRAVATSEGRRGYFRRGSFILDWSVYATRDRAVKQGLAGAHLDEDALAGKLDEARRLAPILTRPPRELPRGGVRAYLAPAAVAELFELLAWGAFGLRAQKTQTSPLAALYRGERALAPMLTVVDDIAHGVAPPFAQSGFAHPSAVTLVDGGAPAAALVSPRSAREYGAVTTGHDAREGPLSLTVAPGTLDDPLAALGDGVAISNLWYLNWSDRRAARVTGMTRYACLVVEGGAPVAPLAPMRFDDSLYRMLGSHLEALTRERALLLSPSTYERRSVEAARVPGALVSSLELTL